MNTRSHPITENVLLNIRLFYIIYTFILYYIHILYCIHLFIVLFIIYTLKGIKSLTVFKYVNFYIIKN